MTVPVPVATGRESAGMRRPRRPETDSTGGRDSNLSNNPIRQQQTARGGGHGMFEACFADGLDLSEFGHGSMGGTSTHRPSAAAELLRQKVIEAERAHQDEAEEARMQANAVALGREQTKRLTLLKQQRDVEGGPRSNGKVAAEADLVNRPVEGTEFLGRGMFSTLVSMHGSDDHGAKREGTRSSTGGGKATSLRARTAAARSSAVRGQSRHTSGVSKQRISRLAIAKGGKARTGNKNRPKGPVKKGRRTKH